MSEPSGLHFTYRAPAGDLSQGDLLAKTPEVLRLLADVHPHYQKDDYSHLLVLTQTCDLQRRSGACGTRYVSLAAVRPLSLVLTREIERYQDDFARAAGVCKKGPKSAAKRAVEELLERILNNNQPEFFYLEPELEYGVAEPSCAFLRLSIAVRAAEHYDKLVAARVLSLTDVFQAKLGWLIGNMYSRVGTPDWVPERLSSRNQFQKKIDLLLGGLVIWVDDEQLERAKATVPPGTADNELREHVKRTTVPRRKEEVLDAVLQLAQQHSLVREEDLTKFRNLLGNDPGLAGLLK